MTQSPSRSWRNVVFSVTFSDLYVEVDYKQVTNPTWVAAQERPACDSVATVVDSATVKISWNPAA